MNENRDQQLHAAMAAVRAATGVCRSVQAQLAPADAMKKEDRSPVTVADFASQAVVCVTLAQSYPGIPVVAEEGTDELRRGDHAVIREAVIRHVSHALGRPVVAAEVMDWIDRGLGDGTAPQYWVLDPIDGTKGFLRREQYAVALALVEGGEVVLAVLGCPNLMIGGVKGVILTAVRGEGTSIYSVDMPKREPRAASVSAVEDPAAARFCESVESGHSDQGASAGIAGLLGITAAPLRMDSQAKYAAVAAGEASIYLRLPTKKDYREKVWDHAAGMLVVEEAGGTVTDADGKKLDFTRGRELSGNRGIVATNGAIHEAVLRAVAESGGR